MSLISKIGKGLKKITLKKALPIVGAVAAFAVPGVGTAVAAGIGAVASGAKRSAVAAGQVVKSAASGAVTVAESASGVITGSLDTITAARQAINKDVAKVSSSVAEFKASAEKSAAGGAVAGFLNAIPPAAWLIIGGIVAAFFIARNSRGPSGRSGGF